jgi:hypothetical protein
MKHLPLCEEINFTKIFYTADLPVGRQGTEKAEFIPSRYQVDG